VYQKYQRDLPLLTHLPPPSGVFPVRFDRYSPYFMRAREYGLDLKASDWYAYVYPFGAEVLEQLAYYFSDQHFDASYIQAMVQYLPSLRRLTSDWITQWTAPANTAANTAAPRLEWDARAGVIVDTRSGTAVTHDVPEDAFGLLVRLTHPCRLTDLLSDSDALRATSVDWLRERQLLFEEDGRAVSLVLGIEPRT